VASQHIATVVSSLMATECLRGVFTTRHYTNHVYLTLLPTYILPAWCSSSSSV